MSAAGLPLTPLVIVRVIVPNGHARHGVRLVVEEKQRAP
jgi:hypothetical protein